MKMCKDHWDKLRHAIHARGLGDLVAGSGQEAAKQMLDEMRGKPKTMQNFDPLLNAHNSILGNAVGLIMELKLDPAPLMFGSPEHPEWECPICYLNYLSEEHDRTCTNPDCKKEKGVRFDNWIDRAANDAADHVKTLPPQ